VIRTTDTADLNARLVATGIRVHELGPERRSLEEVVHERTGAAGDRVDRPGRAGGPGRADRADVTRRVDRGDPR
jgi:ABC-2 type transport system ATP-binding protein